MYSESNLANNKPANPTNQFSIAESEKKRKSNLLQTLCIILLVPQVLSLLQSIAVPFISNKHFEITYYIIMSPVSIGISIYSYLLARKGNYHLGAWLQIMASIFIIAYSRVEIGTDLQAMVFFLLPISFAIVLLEPKETMTITGVCVLFLLGTYAAQDWLHLYTPSTIALPSYINFFVEIIIIPIIIVLLVIPTHSQQQALQKQNDRLEEALHELEARQHASEATSHQVLTLSTELKVTATQQSSSSHQQAALVNQVNTSLDELSAVASHIAEQAEYVNKAADTMALNSLQIEQTGKLAVEQSEKGLSATANTQKMSSEVAILYQQMVATMNELNQKSNNMRRILDLLSSIATETHLLALNASIEAAGVGEHGRRFKIVAQEIKNLAARSGNASQEVVQIIQEIAETTRQAVTSAESGYTKAAEMQDIAGEAGQVIAGMRQVSEQANEQTRVISQIAQEVHHLTETIKLATTQQRTANQQVLEALTGLTDVAQQSANGSLMVSNTAQKLERMSFNLQQALSA
jgi:methyl-accepting chemotaxis protein